MPVSQPMRVFISYAHESEPHRRRVLQLAQDLRARGIDAWIDRFEGKVPEGWPQWMRRQVDLADVVLLVCTPEYVARFEGRTPQGTGVTWEGFLVRQLLYEAGGRNDKVLAGWFEPKALPRDLAVFKGQALGDLDLLVRALHGQPEVAPAPLGSPPASERGLGEAPGPADRLAIAYDQRRATLRAGGGDRALDLQIAALEKEVRGKAALGPGMVLGGRFHLEALIGEGGFAQVWRAFEDLGAGEGRFVALKVLHPQWERAPTYVEQFRKGAARMAGISDPHVVPVLTVPPEDGHPCYPMALMPGGDLRAAVLDKRLDRDRAVAVALEAARGLIPAHARGWMHGDVKPHNMLIDEQGRGRLTDFDLVRLVDAETAQKTRQAGSIYYMAPELEEPPHRGDVRSDVYGLGLTVAFCFLGRDLYRRDAGNIERLVAGLGLSARRRGVLEKALAERPAERWDGVQAFIEAWEGAQGPAVHVGGEIAPGTVLHTAPGGIRLAYIPAGTFWMGSPEGAGSDDERPRRQVTLTRPYLVGVTPVTQAQWRDIARGTGLPEAPSKFKGDDLPVEQVSWEECQRWLAALTTADPARASLSQDAYTLPTEAQWERACRAGTDTAWSFGDDERQLAAHAWHDVNADRRTHPVGQLRPNPWDLHDVHGNVWEWCGDGWSHSYRGLPTEDPLVPLTHGGGRVIRGGSYLYATYGCRSACRGRGYPNFRNGDRGFRVVLPLPRER